MELPEVCPNLLLKTGCLIRQLVFSYLRKHLGMNARINRIGYHKHSGASLHMSWRTDGDMASQAMKTIERHIESCLVQVLQFNKKIEAESPLSQNSKTVIGLK